MLALEPAHRRWRAALAWLALAAVGQGLFAGLPHRHEHESSHERAAHALLVTSTGEAEGCAQRHVHSVGETHEGSCSACALLHGKSFRAQPLVHCTRLAFFEAAVPTVAPASDRRALASLPARGPPSA